MKSGLLVHVLRSPLGDCTNGGVSSKKNGFTLMPGARKTAAYEGGPFQPSPDTPALYLAKWYGRLLACPEDFEASNGRSPDMRDDCSVNSLGGYMFGGNFIYSSDSRFPCEYPIPIFDRKEW